MRDEHVLIFKFKILGGGSSNGDIVILSWKIINLCLSNGKWENFLKVQFWEGFRRNQPVIDAEKKCQGLLLAWKIACLPDFNLQSTLVNPAKLGKLFFAGLSEMPNSR